MNIPSRYVAKALLAILLANVSLLGLCAEVALAPRKLLDFQYPNEALAVKQNGTVVLRYTIRSNGTVKNVIVESGPEDLAAAATANLYQWEFRRTIDDGKLTSSIIYRFVLVSRLPAATFVFDYPNIVTIFGLTK